MTANKPVISTTFTTASGGSPAGWRAVTFTSTASATSTSSAFLLSSLPKGFTYSVKVIALDGSGGVSLPGTTLFSL